MSCKGGFCTEGGTPIGLSLGSSNTSEAVNGGDATLEQIGTL